MSADRGIFYQIQARLIQHLHVFKVNGLAQCGEVLGPVLSSRQDLQIPWTALFH